MRPWIIILSSTIIALGAAAAIALSETLRTPAAEMGPILLPHLPALAVVALAVYALAATLMGTASLLAEAVRARTEMGLDHSHRDADLGANESLLTPAWLTRLTPRAARAEVARAHYILLARSHVFSAAIALAGMIGLGVAQDHGSLSFSWGAVPTVSAILVLAGVVLLTLLGRIAIDVTMEPLLEAIPRPFPDQLLPDGLRRAAESLERAGEAIRSRERGAAHPMAAPDRLATVLDEGQRELLDAVNRLSANTEALQALIRSSVEAIEATVQVAAAQPRPADHAEAGVQPYSFPELQAAVEQLTSVLKQLIAMPIRSPETGPASASAPSRHEPPPPRLAGELRRLLQEIEAS